MSSSEVIQASGLGKAYRLYERPADRLAELLIGGCRRGTDFWALQGIDLTVRGGEAIGVIGRNGSGKSTLLQLVCGLLRPSTGEIAVRGRVAGLLELGAGFNPEFTGRENVEVAAAVLGLRADEIAQRFAAIEAFAGIGAFMDRPVREYSSGMYARLAFAVCAHVDADILVIDEILAVGDAAFQQKCLRYLRAFQAAGGTLLFVSHSEEAVLALCERAVWLDGGRLVADGPSGEVCRRYAAAPPEGGAALQTGGRVPSRAESTPQGDDRSEAMAVAAFDFDPDAVVATGEASIERVGFFTTDGVPLSVAAGGERVELRIDCVAKAAVQNPVVGFVVRNRLGRVVFSDDTGHVRTDARMFEAGQSFTARFSFHTPFMPSGEYSVEAFLFAATPHQPRLLGHAVDSHFLAVRSPYPWEGLANTPVSELKLEVNAPRSLPPRAPVARRG